MFTSALRWAARQICRAWAWLFADVRKELRDEEEGSP